MPGIKFTSFYNRAQNPTPGFVPYNAGGFFADSPISSFEEFTYTQTPSGNTAGIDFNFGDNIYRLGDGNTISVGTGISGIDFKGAGILSNSAFGFATHLIISVNGNDRKIKLLKVTP